MSGNRNIYSTKANETLKRMFDSGGSVVIVGATIDNSVIGGVTPASATFTTLRMTSGAGEDYTIRSDASGNFIYVKNNMDASASPTTNDDVSLGYSSGSMWLNASTNEIFRCIDNTASNADWQQTTLTLDDLGSMAVQNSNSVTITGGGITGLTDLESTNATINTADITTADITTLGVTNASITSANMYIVSGEIDSLQVTNASITNATIVSLGFAPDSDPAIELIDADCADSDVSFRLGIDATATGTGAEDIDVWMEAQMSGVMTTFLTFDASASELNFPLDVSINDLTVTTADIDVGHVATLTVNDLTATTIDINIGNIATLTINGGFGCNAASPQTSYSVDVAATNLESVISLCNQIRSALIANGVCASL